MSPPPPTPHPHTLDFRLFYLFCFCQERIAEQGHPSIVQPMTYVLSVQPPQNKSLLCCSGAVLSLSYSVINIVSDKEPTPGRDLTDADSDYYIAHETCASFFPLSTPPPPPLQFLLCFVVAPKLVWLLENTIYVQAKYSLILHFVNYYRGCG